MSDNPKHNSEDNNYGTIGGDGGVDKQGKGSFHQFTENLKEPEAPNVRGVRENEEVHASGSQAKHFPEGGYKANEVDPNEQGHHNPAGKDIIHPKSGPNHIDNVGGTSQQDIDEANGL